MPHSAQKQHYHYIFQHKFYNKILAHFSKNRYIRQIHGVDYRPPKRPMPITIQAPEAPHRQAYFSPPQSHSPQPYEICKAEAHHTTRKAARNRKNYSHLSQRAKKAPPRAALVPISHAKRSRAHPRPSSKFKSSRSPSHYSRYCVIFQRLGQKNFQNYTRKQKNALFVYKILYFYRQHALYVV